MKSPSDGGAAPRRVSRRKPATCPTCGSTRVGKILYGLPALSEKLVRDMREGTVVIGGCVVTGDDPAWRCADCNQPIYHRFSREAR